MKKQITFLLLLVLPYTTFSQVSAKDPIYIDTVSVSPDLMDSTAVGLGITLGDNQNFNRKHHPDILISQPTIISSGSNKIGELKVKAFVTTDNINIIAAGINSKNIRNFKAFKRWPNGREELLEIYISNLSPAILVDNTLNKFKVYGGTYTYLVKNLSEQIVSQLSLQFILPKPQLLFLSLDPKIINFHINRPGEFMNFSRTEIMKMNKEVTSENLETVPVDKSTYIPQHLVLPHNKSSLFFCFKTIDHLDHYLEYKINDDSTWRTSVKSRYPFLILNDMKVGKYKMQVRYPHQKDFTFEYQFEIKPVWTETTTFKVLIGSFLTAFFCLGLFLMNYYRQKKKLNNELDKRKQLQNQILSMRAQLHPHFIFNALSSIQGLVNKNNINEANLYISRFGTLLHDVLDKNDKAYHPLSNEIRQVENYILLEQLRFNFSYNIFIDPTLNTSEIDIPVMLLQPFVENAIKHGINEVRERRMIELKFEERESDLIVVIKDNGKGYDTNGKSNGYGNKLISERVEVINKLLKHQKISIKVDSQLDKGTTVSIFFQNWL